LRNKRGSLVQVIFPEMEAQILESETPDERKSFKERIKIQELFLKVLWSWNLTVNNPKKLKRKNMSI